MKKFIPVLIGIGVIIVAVVAFFVIRGSKGSSSSSSGSEEANTPLLPESEWPAISLTPTSDPTVSGSLGHWLDFKVEKINVQGATSMDYLLVYNTSDGGQQGVPGTVKLTGGDIDRPLLLGSESSGKYRYDDGVEQGTMTITFRDSNGKSVGKLATDFHLQTGVTALTSVDGTFTYNLDKIAKNVYFVTMKTYLEPTVASVVWQNGYGVFASDGKVHSGKLAQ
ncbi:MAG: hypothetical protein ABSC49_02295 [Candidatus Microgenomates bacterium]